jgi:predicted RecA/RadA family phage recombinase
MAQTQTPTIYREYGDAIDYTPGSAVFAGDVIVVGGLVMVAKHDIDLVTITKGSLAIRGIFEFPKDASVFAAGDPVYWNAAGNPTVGTAGTGCASSTAAGTTFAGWATQAQVTGDATVMVDLTASTGVSSKRVGVNTVAATGSIISDAAPVIEGLNFVTAANGTKGVLLPVGFPGARVIVKNDGAAAAVLKVWPQTGAQINALAASNPISLASTVSAEFYCYSATQWYTLPLLPS